jgi:hypothetical protein
LWISDSLTGGVLYAAHKPLHQARRQEPQMSRSNYFSVVVLAWLAAATTPRAEGQQPQVLPTRDVDISYQITRPDQPALIERRRWSAAEHLQRVDGPDRATTIFDRNKGEFTLLNPANRTYRKFEGVPRLPMAPRTGSALQRGGEALVIGLPCVDWSWSDDDIVTRTACLTPDGVMLRLIVGGKTVMQARSVSYGAQPAKLFEVPQGYEPALAPEGGAGE